MTPLARQSAFLDAQGCTPTEIAQAIGCHVKRVSQWRAYDEYLAERKMWQERALVKLEPLIARLRSSALDAHEAAIVQVQEALRAVKHVPAGSEVVEVPDWSVRLKAIEIIANAPVLKAVFGPGAANPTASAAATVTLVIKTNESGDETIEYGEVAETEEVEDGDREDRGAGDDQP